ncbi:MAG: 23S rRNA (adenine(2503)-C(2))-methyltransferase RlmN, partial [Candidatus Aminicenantes bacterium]|nr:23S rRNA (adenine(2503)-C(2))-methyltransferase RlmN [Candidatus Aminicenantes bacterium]
LTLEELRAAFEEIGEPGYRAEQAFARLYRKGDLDFSEWTDFPRPLRERLAERFASPRLELYGRLKSKDGTEKCVFRLRDAAIVEAVLIPSGGRATVCLSSQAGCKFRCAFCASGLDGFKRNLGAGEVVGQVLGVRAATGRAPTHLVVMGMGEPLDNFDNAVKALRILNDRRGMGIAARRMTVSTAGHVPGIARFAALGLQVNLSLSLHAVTDALRSELMPINRTYSLRDLLDACERYVEGGGRKMTLEYVLIRGVNDGPADAEELARIAKRLWAKVNLIPYSPVLGLSFRASDPKAAAAFKRRLEAKRVPVTLRRSQGADILAACGQLAARV